MPSFITQNKKIGVLGGGQLARMLCQQGQKMGLKVFVLSENPDDPAALVTPHWVKGSIKSSRSLQKFAQQVDFITFESEFADTLQVAKALNGMNKKIYPSLKNIALLQDRLSQKQALKENKINTSEFIHSNQKSDLEDFFLQHKAFVAKKRFNGYDGYGTFIVKNKKSLASFLLKNKNSLDQYIIEEFVPFRRELSLVTARSCQGDFYSYPLVESLQKDAKCFWVKGPISSPKLKTFEKQVSDFLKELNYVGVIAFELFEHKGQLIVNEVAPRVHNTGHHSLDAFNIDQFSLHLHCLLGSKLPKIKSFTKGFAMINLIGSTKKSAKLGVGNNSHLHWYQKTENRPGRKMGHLNTLSTSPNKALQLGLNDLKGYRL